MDHESYQDLIRQMAFIRDSQYRSDPDRHEAILANLQYTVQTILEKLRNEFEPLR